MANRYDQVAFDLLNLIAREGVAGAAGLGHFANDAITSVLTGGNYGNVPQNFQQAVDQYLTPKREFMAQNFNYTPGQDAQATEQRMAENLLGLFSRAPESVKRTAASAAQIAEQNPEALAAIDMLSLLPGGGQAAAAGGGLLGLAKVLPGGGKVQQTGNIVRRGIDQFHPKFDERKKQQERLNNLVTDVEGNVPNPPTVSIYDLEGRPFVTSMSDRTAGGGRIVGLNEVPVRGPDLMGGQDFMFLEDAGAVWASGKGPSGQILNLSNQLESQTGQQPLFLPWRMSPTGGDFATMTGETMIAYASANMSKADKKALDKAIREFKTVGTWNNETKSRIGEGLSIKGWKGVDDPRSIDAWRNAPDRVRKELKNMMDVEFKDRGGLGLGEARLAVADPNQLIARTGGLMNVGEIDTGRSLYSSPFHPSYPYLVPGQGVGRLKEDVSAFQLLPDLVEGRKMDVDNPSHRDFRSLQMKPFGGIITEEILRGL